MPAYCILFTAARQKQCFDSATYVKQLMGGLFLPLFEMRACFKPVARSDDNFYRTAAISALSTRIK
jgi:hypothetical protein